MKKFFIIGGVVLFILIIILVLVILLSKEKKIEDMKYLRFSYSTGYHMYAYVIYEIELKDGKYIASIKPTDIPDEEAKEVELSKEEIQEIENKLNEYHVSRWDGFNKIDKNVLDGNSFSLTIRYKNDSIGAHGYMKWPYNYREVRAYLDSLFSKYTKE